MQVCLGPGHIVLAGTQLPSPKREHSPQFSALVYCGLTAGWIKMSFGMGEGLGPRQIVLHGDPAPPKRRPSPLIFGPCGQTAGWIKMPLCSKVGLGPGHILLHGDPE